MSDIQYESADHHGGSAPHANPTAPGAGGDPSVPTTPVAPRERIHALDALRGFALCGIIVINVPQTMEMFAHAGELPDALRWFVLGRFYPIFYTLFGVGFGLFLRSATRRTDRPRVLLVRRFVALAVLGAVLHLLQPGEVLLPFAIAGVVVLLPLSYLSARTNLIVGVILTVAGVAAGVGGFGLLPGLFALGFAMAEFDIPATLLRRTRELIAGFGLAVAIALVTVGLVFAELPDIAQIRLGTTLSLAMSTAYAALFLLLVLRTPLGPVLSSLLAPMGRMALTNYVTQALLFVPIGAAIGLRESANWTGALLLAVGILVLQAVWSTWWLRVFSYGPLEWVWRCVTYWRRLPSRKAGSG